MSSSCKIAKNQQKIDEKSMQNWNWKKTFKKCFKNWIRKGLGLQLGGGWDGLSRLLGTCGHFFVVFLVFSIHFFQTWVNMGPRWAPRGLWHRFGVDFGRVLEGFGEGLGRVWGEIWKDLGIFWHVVSTFWKHLEKCGPAAAELLNWTPALLREASQCAGVPLPRG